MRLSDEGNETVTNCNALKFPAADGRLQHRIVGDSFEKIINSDSKWLRKKK